MAVLIIALVIAACIAYQYLAGTLVKSFAMLINAICAAAVAFGYFETSAALLISKEIMVPWAYALSFAALFVLTFAVLQLLCGFLTRKQTDFGIWPDRLGRILCAAVAGLLIAGITLIALALAPLSDKIPYQRLDRTYPNPEKPKKAILNLDELTIRCFSFLSKASLSGNKSFAAMHPDFLTEMALNKNKNVSITTKTAAIKLLKESAAWSLTKTITDAKGEKTTPKSGYQFYVLHLGITESALNDAGTFTLGQLRLLCKENKDKNKPLTGTAQNAYPIGYMKNENQIVKASLNDQIQLTTYDFAEKVRYIDFVFEVPANHTPDMVAFKLNNIALIPSVTTADEAPSIIPFIPAEKCASLGTAEIQPLENSRIYGTELAVGAKLLSGLLCTIDDQQQFQAAQSPNSIEPAEFSDQRQIYRVRAMLKTEKLTEKEIAGVRRQATQKINPARRFGPQARKQQAVGLSDLLQQSDGYELVSLKCNNPTTPAQIKGKDLPVLLDLAGKIHHTVGLVALSIVGENIIYEVDYCSRFKKDQTGCLSVTEDGTVAQPFPENIWLTNQTDRIEQFYVLYLIKTGKTTIITAVKPADSQTPAGFEKYEGFIIR